MNERKHIMDNLNVVDTDSNIQCVSCGNTIPVARCPHCGVLPVCITDAARQDARVVAIRADKLIGEDSCSFVDECLSAVDLVDELDRENIESPVEAVVHFIEAQDLKYEMGLNARAGNDDDPELKQWDEWSASRKSHLLKLAS